MKTTLIAITTLLMASMISSQSICNCLTKTGCSYYWDELKNQDSCKLFTNCIDNCDGCDESCNSECFKGSLSLPCSTLGASFFFCGYHLCYEPGNWKCVEQHCSNDINECQQDQLCRSKLENSWQCDDSDFSCLITVFSGGSQNQLTNKVAYCIYDNCHSGAEDYLFADRIY